MGRTMEAPALWGDRGFVSPETYDALVALLSRIEAVIDAETAMLRLHSHAGLPEFTRQKRQGLLELNRLMKAMANTVPSQDLIAKLAAFRAKLAANDGALQVELRAAQEVSATIVRTLREFESDGTYSRAHGRADFGRADGGLGGGFGGGYGWE